MATVVPTSQSSEISLLGTLLQNRQHQEEMKHQKDVLSVKLKELELNEEQLKSQRDYYAALAEQARSIANENIANANLTNMKIDALKRAENEYFESVRQELVAKAAGSEADVEDAKKRGEIAKRVIDALNSKDPNVQSLVNNMLFGNQALESAQHLYQIANSMLAAAKASSETRNYAINLANETFGKLESPGAAAIKAVVVGKIIQNPDYTNSEEFSNYVKSAIEAESDYRNQKELSAASLKRLPTGSMTPPDKLPLTIRKSIPTPVMARMMNVYSKTGTYPELRAIRHREKSGLFNLIANTLGIDADYVYVDEDFVKESNDPELIKAWFNASKVDADELSNAKPSEKGEVFNRRKDNKVRLVDTKTGKTYLVPSSLVGTYLEGNKSLKIAESQE